MIKDTNTKIGRDRKREGGNEGRILKVKREQEGEREEKCLERATGRKENILTEPQEERKIF